MAKKKRQTGKKATAEFGYFWPGPMRLYDSDVDAGAVLLCGEHARAIVLAVADSLRHGKHDDVTRGRMVTAVAVLNETFRLGIGDDESAVAGPEEVKGIRKAVKR